MPDWAPHVRSRLSSLRLSPTRENEIVEELSQHLEDRWRELVAGGASEDEATRLALAEFSEGNLLTRYMIPLRQAHAAMPVTPGAPARGWLADGWQDLVYAAKMLRKSPGFASAAILTLALGIGANSALFSLVNATLLQHLPVQNRDRLSYVFSGDNWAIASYPAYAATRDAARLLDGLVAWGYIAASLNVDGDTDVVNGAIVTGNFFEAFGLSANVGRLLSTSDDVTPMGHPVAVISHRLWQSRFGGRADIVGHEVRLNGRPFTIVGVTPSAFPGPQLGTTRDIYVPMMMQPLIRPPRAGYSGEMDPDLLKNPNNGWLFLMAVRKHGVSGEQAAAELSAIATTYVRARSPNAPAPQLTLVPIDAGNPTQTLAMSYRIRFLRYVIGHLLESRSSDESSREEPQSIQDPGGLRARHQRLPVDHSVTMLSVASASGGCRPLAARRIAM